MDIDTLRCFTYARAMIFLLFLFVTFCLVLMVFLFRHYRQPDGAILLPLLLLSATKSFSLLCEWMRKSEFLI